MCSMRLLDIIKNIYILLCNLDIYIYESQHKLPILVRDGSHSLQNYLCLSPPRSDGGSKEGIDSRTQKPDHSAAALTVVTRINRSKNSAQMGRTR